MKKSKHSKKNSKLKLISGILLLVGIVLFVYSSFNIIKWFLDSNRTKNMITKINESVSIKEDDTGIDTNTDIDFSKLNDINSDTVRMDTSCRM